MNTSPEQLAVWLAAPEGPRLEFKEAKSNFHFEKLVDYSVALANEGGGVIILGVTDRRPRRPGGLPQRMPPTMSQCGKQMSHVNRILTNVCEGSAVFFHAPAVIPAVIPAVKPKL